MIGYLILYCTAIAAMLGLAAFAAESALRLFRLPTRGVWVAAGIAALAIPAFAVTSPWGGTAVLVLPQQLDLATPAAMVWEARTTLEGWDRPLLALWLAGSAILLLVVARSVVRTLAMRRAWNRTQMAGCAVWVSEDVGPAILGLVRPSIVVPRWALRADVGSQELIVAHEQQHIAAGDQLLVILSGVALVMMPWNLPLWWVWRRLRLAIEVDCDARVLRRIRPDVASYGTLLLEVGRRTVATAAPATAFSRPPSSLEHRIRLMTTRNSGGDRAYRATVLATFTLALLGLASTTPDPRFTWCGRDTADMAAGGEHSVLIGISVGQPVVQRYLDHR